MSDPTAHIQLRPCETADLDALVAIEEASFPNAWSRDVLSGWLERLDTDCQVFVVDGEIVAFFLVVYEPDSVHLVNLAVEPSQRRQGLGLIALEAVEALAENRSAERIVLEVRETNLPGQLLYKKGGFRAVGILEGFYDSEDAYRMVKRLVG